MPGIGTKSNYKMKEITHIDVSKMNDNQFRETIEEFRPDVCIDLAEDIKDNSDCVAKEYRGEVENDELDRQNWRAES